MPHRPRPRGPFAAGLSLLAAVATLSPAGPAAAQTFTWDDSTGDNLWFTDGNWDLAGVPNGARRLGRGRLPEPDAAQRHRLNIDTLTVTADGDLTVNPNFNLDLQTTGFLTNAGSITTLNNTDLVFVNTVDNSGTISVNSTGSATDIELRTDVNLTGGGTITLSGANAGVNDNSTIINLLTVTDQTIQGEGRFGPNTIAVINTAGNLIDANVNGGTLTLDPAAAGSLFDFDNQGTMQASNGGILLITGSGGGDFGNVGGTIQALAGSEVQFTTNSDITGGTIQSVGTGVVRVNTGQNAFFSDLTLDGNIVSDNNTDFGVSGNINLLGDLNIKSPGSFTDLEIQEGGATLTGGGTVILSGGNAGIIDSSTTVNVLTIDDQTIEGEGRFGPNTIAVINEADGLIDANDATGTLTLDPVDGVGSDDFDNAGTLRASNGGTLTLTGNAGGSFNNTGTIDALAGSTVQTVTGAVINQIDDADDSIDVGTYRAIDGTLNLAPSADFDLAFNDGATLEFSGTAANTDLFAQASSPGAFVSDNFVSNFGTLILRDGASLTTNAGDFANVGILFVGAGSTFSVTGDTINNEQGSNSFIGGAGTIDGSVNNGFTGILAPGNLLDTFGSSIDTATLAITGDLTLTGGSGPDGVQIDIAGSGDNDQLAVGGALALAGALEIDLAASFNPDDGEQFLIATATPGSISGMFSTINDDSALYDFTQVIDNAGGNIFLQAVLIAEPASLALLLAGLPLLTRRRRAA